MHLSFLDLPPEIIMQVMDYVGPSYFYEDLGRPVICKRWFAFFRTVIFKHLRLSPKTLRRLLSSQDASGNMLLAKENLRVLDFEMKGCDDWSSLPDPQACPPIVITPHPARACGRSLPANRTMIFNNDLVQLANLAKESRNLHSIRIKARIKVDETLPYPCDYLTSSALRSILLVDNLTALDLDLLAIPLSEPLGKTSSRNNHICESIGALLTTLTRLRLRMRDICADVLKPKHHHGSKLRLSEVVINLSLSYSSWQELAKVYSTRCRSSVKTSNHLTSEIETQAMALLPKMASPKVFRILSHAILHLEPMSFDVLTGKRMRLTEEMAWEDDGEVIEDVSDQESSDIPSLSDQSYSQQVSEED